MGEVWWDGMDLEEERGIKARAGEIVAKFVGVSLAVFL